MNQIKYGMVFAIVFMMGLGSSVAGNFSTTMGNMIGHSGNASLQNGNFTVDAGGPYEGKVGEPIHFHGSVTGGAAPYEYYWSFGDGGSSKQQNPTHTYNKAGVYTVTFMVTDSSFPPNEATDTTTATITGGGDALVVDIGGPYNGSVGEEIHFNCTVTGGTEPYSYHWSFGGGGGSKEQNPTHIYNKAGVYTVTLMVMDSSLPPNKDIETTTATITGGENSTLVVDIGGPYNGSVGEEIHFNCTVKGGTEPYEYYWSFGDGTHSNEPNPTHVYTKERTYLVRLMVKDSAQRTYIRHDFSWVYIT